MEIVGDLLKRCLIPDHGPKSLDRILSVFAVLFSEFPLKLISRLDVEFISPFGDRTLSNVKKERNLSVSKRLDLHLVPDKLFNPPLICFQSSLLPPLIRIKPHDDT